MFCLFEKIKSYQMALIRWSKMAFGNTKVGLQEKHRKIEELLNKIIQNNGTEFGE